MKALASIGLTLLVAGCASVLEEDLSTSEDAIRQCATATVEGVDVSAHNGDIDWVKVKASGVGWAAMKATQGTTHINRTFADNWKNSKAAGVIPTAYHFFDPTKDGVEQANHFLAVMGELREGDLAPMLDLECPDGNDRCLGYAGGSGEAPGDVILKRTLDWLNTVEAATGMKPIIYTSNAYFNGAGVDATSLTGYPLFIASLTSGSCFNFPAPWTKATYWQYGWKGIVPGIEGECDVDRFLGTLDELKAHTKQAATAAR